MGSDVYKRQLILLSDINGLYSSDPNKNKSTVFIEEIPEITDEIERMAGPPITGVSSGGMITKIAAAKIATKAGCNMIICNGHDISPLSKLEIDGTQFSWFSAIEKPLNSRKQWISGALQVKGKITIDKGAVEAIKKGFSMLSAGIVSTEGNYEKGDLIQIVDERQNFVGKGLIPVSYTHLTLPTIPLV